MEAAYNNSKLLTIRRSTLTTDENRIVLKFKKLFFFFDFDGFFVRDVNSVQKLSDVFVLYQDALLNGGSGLGHLKHK